MATETNKAGTETLSRQQRYKVIRFREGKCFNCGKPREDSPFKRLCEVCSDQRKKQRRKKLGSKAWKPGSPGRPPLKTLKVSRFETEAFQTPGNCGRDWVKGYLHDQDTLD